MGITQRRLKRILYRIQLCPNFVFAPRLTESMSVMAEYFEGSYLIVTHGYNSHKEGNPNAQRECGGAKKPTEQVSDLAKGGEEIVIRHRNLPVAKLIPFSAEGADDQELMLVAAGKLRLPSVRLDVKELLKIPTGKVTGNKAMQAVLADREEER